jgi:3-deoxy-7-phosphoheptulonate synthase
MATGLEMARSLFIDLAEKEIPVAMEFLELMSAHYLADLVSWGVIGARTSSSQPHRQLASCLPMPIGFKNSTDGDILTAVQGAFSASFNHTFMSINDKGLISTIQSKGNKHTHIVLRGGVEKPNYDKNSINDAMELCHKMGIKKELIVDCSHDNSYKDYKKQKEVFNEVLNQVLLGNHHIIGAMLESHLFSGNQPHTGNLKYAISLTDPCIDWLETEKIILDAFEKLSSISNDSKIEKCAAFKN